MERVSQLNLITVGYAKRALESGTRERLRMLKYSSVMSELHVVVFTRKSENFPPVQQDGNLFLYATNSRTRLGMLYSAYVIGRTIINNNVSKSWIVSSQDPFETALVCRAIAGSNRATNHVQIHGDFFNPGSYRWSLLQRLRVIYGKYVIKHSLFIRVVSERIKQSLELLGIPATSIVVLPIQSDLTSFLEVGNKRIYNEQKPCSFLYVGRFSIEKNIPLLIESFYKIAKKFPLVTLTLLGSGSLQHVLEQRIKKCGLSERVTVCSWNDDVPSVMSVHDVLCLSSDHEGWGMVLLEAAAAGMPVVTTDVGCAGEVIRNNENGQVVPVGDTEKYADSLRLYCEKTSLVAKHGGRSREIASGFIISDTEYLQKMVDSYSSCLAPKPAILTGNGTS